MSKYVKAYKKALRALEKRETKLEQQLKKVCAKADRMQKKIKKAEQY